MNIGLRRGESLPLRRLHLSFAKYRMVFGISLRNNLAYVGEMLSRTFFLILIMFVMVQLWQVVYGTARSGQLAGFTLVEVLWYIAMTEAFATSRPMINADIDREVRSGEIAYMLARPYNYLLYHFSVYLATRLVRYGLNFGIAAAIVWLLVGAPSWFRLESLLAFLTLLPLALVLDFLFLFAIAIQSFWAEDTNGFILIYNRLMTVLGGMLIPLDLLPEPFASIFKAIPLSYMMYTPASVTVRFNWEGWLDGIVKLGLTTVIVGAFAFWIMRVVERRMSSNGG
jgi:ABC-2 type transport system permease protein